MPDRAALLEIPRCDGCGQPTEARAFEPIELDCACCGHRFDAELPTGGALRLPEVGWKALFRRGDWLDAYLARAERGMVVAACPKCQGPVTVGLSEPLTARCGHCSSEAFTTVDQGLVDAVPSARISGQSWGGGLDVRWTPEVKAGSTGGPVDCPSCGAGLPSIDGRADCPHCSTTLYAVLAGGRRFLPGVRVQGDDEGRPVDGWMPVTEAIAYYSGLLRLRRVSRRLTWGAILGVVAGIPAVVVIGLVGMVVVGLVSAADAGAGLGAALGLVGGLAAMMLLGFGGLLVGALVWHKRARRALGVDGRAPVVTRRPPG